MALPEFGFYHLQRTGLEPALGGLLEKVLASGQRAVVQASSPERVEALNRALWALGRDSFLPHGSRADGEAEVQPVFLTHEEDYPNGAAILILVDGAEVDPSDRFSRCLYLFDGNDAGAVERARALWRRWRAEGAVLTYWQQGERGWRKAMSSADGG
jgi:DNA polymerase-3 subunit chi